MLSLLSKRPRLETVRIYSCDIHRKYFRDNDPKRPGKIGTWICFCGHTNPVYYLPSYLHPLSMMACNREGCDLTWHPSTNPITPRDKSNLVVVVRLPDPMKPSEDDALYILPYPKKSVLNHFEESGGPPAYGYVCLGEKCGLSWATKVVKEWPWGSSRKVLAVAGRPWKGSCMCGRRVQIGGGFAVFEVVRRQ